LWNKNRVSLLLDELETGKNKLAKRRNDLLAQAGQLIRRHWVHGNMISAEAVVEQVHSDWILLSDLELQAREHLKPSHGSGCFDFHGPRDGSEWTEEFASTDPAADRTTSRDGCYVAHNIECVRDVCANHG
jgi:hypothetical protein